MTTQPARQTGYRARLQQQLELVGPTAILMLEETTGIDTIIVLAALEAATLLCKQTVGPEAGALRERVLRAAQRSSVPDRLVRDQLSSAVLAWPKDDVLEREAHVRELVALGGLRSVVSTSEQWRLDRILEDSLAAFELSPEDYADLSELAVYMDDELDLPTSHPVSVLLDSLRLAEILSREPLAATSLEAAYQAARAEVASQQTSIRVSWATALARFGDAVADFVRGVEARPALALAADVDDDCAELPRDRICLWTRADYGELNLVAADHLLQVEWFGDPGDTAPNSVSLGGVKLTEQTSPLLGARLWALPDTPAGERLSLVMTFGDAEISVTTEERDEAR